MVEDPLSCRHNMELPPYPRYHERNPSVVMQRTSTRIRGHPMLVFDWIIGESPWYLVLAVTVWTWPHGYPLISIDIPTTNSTCTKQARTINQFVTIYIFHCIPDHLIILPCLAWPFDPNSSVSRNSPPYSTQRPQRSRAVRQGAAMTTTWGCGFEWSRWPC